LKREGSRVILKFNNHPFAQMCADVEEERQRWGGPPYFITDELVESTRTECRESDLVVAMSESVCAALVSDGVPSSKVRRAHYGVDTLRFRPSERPKGGFVVAFVGWLDLRKGYPYLIQAFRDAAIPGSELLLHGGSGVAYHHEHVARLRGDAVVRVVKGPVEETYEKASVVVLPSVSDAFGNVVPEAMASGVPVIVTDRCGASEIVHEGVDGFVVPSRDPVAIRGRLLQLHEEPDLLRRMSAAARETALCLPWSAFEEDIGRIAREALSLG